MNHKTPNEVQQMSFLYKGNTILRTHPQHQGHLTNTIKKSCYPEHASTQMPKQVHAFLGLVGYYRKCIKNFAKIAKPFMLLTSQQVNFDFTLTHHNAFLTQGINHPSTNNMVPKS